ncbi:bifunctional 4-hydroxy-2-oxoglutarate aldolase/2-dehydro-3-deoxy-phosphogluconate aldolase [Microbacterium sp. gxy059]|uniref:bifunctional 4-hydroxy-2-oxoglutarate aldolase/2-dehydro-3-deoxy-phosphogluconate aldolase n=1 Tax=Microbacterium sp. gxy059 TaxID=2957199 RepID=UPI003D98D7E4
MIDVFDARVVPLASISDPAHVDAIGDGLAEGGLPVVEVALRGAHGLAAIERLAARGDLLVGAGTVLDPERAERALDAGAAFVVAPGFDERVVDAVRAAGVPMIPGVLTPTEVQRALAAGLTRLKLFPAGAVDALGILSAYADVFREARFMPSGGVREANLAEHLAHPAVFAASGSWIAAAAAHGAEAVAQAARSAVAIAARA